MCVASVLMPYAIYREWRRNTRVSKSYWMIVPLCSYAVDFTKVSAIDRSSTTPETVRVTYDDGHSVTLKEWSADATDALITAFNRYLDTYK